MKLSSERNYAFNRKQIRYAQFEISAIRLTNHAVWEREELLSAYIHSDIYTQIQRRNSFSSAHCKVVIGGGRAVFGG